MKSKATLYLEDGSSVEGYCFAAEKSASGEVVFNTGMVGYPEVMTDPSYHGQILVLTYPLIGNYGVPGKERDGVGLLRNFESEGIQVKGLVVSDYSYNYSHWNAKSSLGEWMKKEKIPGIFGVDTRALTKKIERERNDAGKDCL